MKIVLISEVEIRITHIDLEDGYDCVRGKVIVSEDVWANISVSRNRISYSHSKTM